MAMQDRGAPGQRRAGPLPHQETQGGRLRRMDSQREEQVDVVEGAEPASSGVHGRR